jgi:hypothetical protein
VIVEVQRNNINTFVLGTVTDFGWEGREETKKAMHYTAIDK